MEERKYKLIESSRAWLYGRPIYRIQALRDFSDVKKGDLGGICGVRRQSFPRGGLLDLRHGTSDGKVKSRRRCLSARLLQNVRFISPERQSSTTRVRANDSIRMPSR